MSGQDTTPNPKRIEEEAQAAGRLLPLVYDELRRLAAAKISREAPGQTLQPTALVHEVWLRLGGDQQPQWSNRAHFFAAAAEGMRRILIDNARRKRAVRHGGQLARISADATGFDLASPPGNDEEILLVNEAIDGLAAHDPRKAELVKLRYFAGLTLEEAADAAARYFGQVFGQQVLALESVEALRSGIRQIGVPLTIPKEVERLRPGGDEKLGGKPVSA